MSAGAAVLAITAALALGWYGAKMHSAEGDHQSAKNRLTNAVKAAWAARGVMAVAVVIGVVLVNLWFHGKGR